MSQNTVKTVRADELQPSPDEAQQVALVYRNEFDEIAMVSTIRDGLAVESSFSGLALVFVLSLLALVTISRRKIG